MSKEKAGKKRVLSAHVFFQIFLLSMSGEGLLRLCSRFLQFGLWEAKADVTTYHRLGGILLSSSSGGWKSRRSKLSAGLAPLEGCEVESVLCPCS